MVKREAATPEAYLSELAEKLSPGYEEGMQYGMIGYFVPLDLHPDTYNGQPLSVATLASQKNYISLYLLGVCYDPETELWFKERFKASGKRLDMGKSCLRFRRLDDLPLEVIGEAISRVSPEDLIERYKAARTR